MSDSTELMHTGDARNTKGCRTQHGATSGVTTRCDSIGKQQFVNFVQNSEVETTKFSISLIAN